LGRFTLPIIVRVSFFRQATSQSASEGPSPTSPRRRPPSAHPSGNRCYIYLSISVYISICFYLYTRLDRHPRDRVPPRRAGGLLPRIPVETGATSICLDMYLSLSIYNYLSISTYRGRVPPRRQPPSAHPSGNRCYIFLSISISLYLSISISIYIYLHLYLYLSIYRDRVPPLYSNSFLSRIPVETGARYINISFYLVS